MATSQHQCMTPERAARLVLDRLDHLVTGPLYKEDEDSIAALQTRLKIAMDENDPGSIEASRDGSAYWESCGPEMMRLFGRLFFFGLLENVKLEPKKGMVAEGLLGETTDHDGVVTIEVDPDAEPELGRVDRVDSITETLLHECTHAYFFVSSCQGVRCHSAACRIKFLRSIGLGGHLECWQDVARRLEEVGIALIPSISFFLNREDSFLHDLTRYGATMTDECLKRCFPGRTLAITADNNFGFVDNPDEPD